MSISSPPVRTRINVPITEEFRTIGYGNYSTYQATTNGSAMGRVPGNPPFNFGLTTQTHIDVRTFNDPVGAGIIPENWTASPITELTLGPNPSFNNWLTLSASLAAGTTIFTSVAQSLDLTLLGPDSVLTLAIPSFPVSGISITECFLSLSDGSNTNSISFFEGEGVVGGSVGSTLPILLGSGAIASTVDMLSFPISAFSSIDLTHVNEVSILLEVTGPVTVNLMALRLVSPDWIAADMDFDNWNGFYRQTIPLTGATSYYPVSVSEQIPPIWRTAVTGSTDDPQPIDATMAVVFNTGSATQQNFLTLNMRAVGGTDTSQLLLDNKVQAQLNGPQPGLIPTAELPREISDFEGLSMADLNGMSMQDFDVVEKQVDQTWIQFTIQWGTAPYVQVANSVNLDTGYLWTGSHLPGFANDTYYMALLSLEDTQARIQIFNLNQDNFALTPSQGLTAAQLTVGNTINAIPMTGNTKIPAGIVEVSDGINSQLFVTLTGAAALSSSLPIVPTAPIYAFPTGSVISVSSAPPSTFFDTGIINDSYQFIRRPGRIGWQATFNDGDASLRSIRPESLVFAEYQSSVMASNTPVQAARLYAQFTPNTQMWQFFTALSSDGVEGPIISGSIPEPPPSNELYPFEGLYPSQGLYPF